MEYIGEASSGWRCELIGSNISGVRGSVSNEDQDGSFVDEHGLSIRLSIEIAWVLILDEVLRMVCQIWPDDCPTWWGIAQNLWRHRDILDSENKIYVN